MIIIFMIVLACVSIGSYWCDSPTGNFPVFFKEGIPDLPGV